MSTKQVTITVTQSIHQVDKNGKVKKSLTTYEVMKPVETLKQVATQNTWAQGTLGEAKEKLWNKWSDCVFVEKSLQSDGWRKHSKDAWLCSETMNCTI